MFTIKRSILPLVLMLLCFCGSALAQSEMLAKPKALLTLSFVRYLGWSDEARQGDFVIGVIRDKDIASNLASQSAGKKFGYQDVVIKSFKSVADVEDCQVLIVSHNISFERNANTILDKVGKDTLIVTEEEGATGYGSMINFVIRDGKLRFELHKKNAAFSNIQIGQKLTDMQAAINL